MCLYLNKIETSESVVLNIIWMNTSYWNILPPSIEHTQSQLCAHGSTQPQSNTELNKYDI